VPVGPHITDFVSFPLRCVIDLVSEDESGQAARNRAEKRAYLEERGYRVVEVRVEDVEKDLTKALGDLFAVITGPPTGRR
jgi:tRNA/rRNA methyltransferase